MKKTYLQPEMSVTNDTLECDILAESLNLFEEKATETDGGWVKRDNGAWDIWGTVSE